MNHNKLADQLVVDEGRKRRIYQDTVGKWTAGVGRNLSDRDFSDDEIALMLKNDIAIVMRELDINIPWWHILCDARQNVLANMCFNLGINRLLGFKKMLAHVVMRRYDDAAKEMLSSKWAKQVGQRAVRLAEMMRTGEFLE